MYTIVPMNLVSRPDRTSRQNRDLEEKFYREAAEPWPQPVLGFGRMMAALTAFIDSSRPRADEQPEEHGCGAYACRHG